MSISIATSHSQACRKQNLSLYKQPPPKASAGKMDDKVVAGLSPICLRVDMAAVYAAAGQVQSSTLVVWKIEKRIRDEIIKAERDLKTPESVLSSNIHNLAQNRLAVLELMFERLDNGWYDEESDFEAEYQNTVDELAEACASGGYRQK